MDYASLRKVALSRGNEGSVSVNQRLLIDKMLSRYSSDFVVCRELIQNSDDAQANNFIMDLLVKQDENKIKIIEEIRCTNNGRVFGENDWNRLTAIAEGNPDESVVGMFGVGFYSTFSWCEEPLVISGNKYMAFIWNGNSLQTFTADYNNDKIEGHVNLSGTNTNNNNKQLTSVVMKMRDNYVLNTIPNLSKSESKKAKNKKSKNNKNNSSSENTNTISTTPTLDLPSLTQFFTKVLSFTKNLQSILVNINGCSVFQVSKQRTNPIVHNLSSMIRSNNNMFSTQKLIESKQIFTIQQTPNFDYNNYNNKKENIIEKDILHLKHVESVIDTNLDTQFKQNTLRIMKKNLPNQTTIQMLFPITTDINTINNTHPILRNLIPFRTKSITEFYEEDDEKELKLNNTNNDYKLEVSGQLFIGLATSQSSGLGVSIHGQLIPTIERELIDLQDPYLSQWNRELLFTAGQLIRSIYTIQFNSVKQQNQQHNQSLSLNNSIKNVAKSVWNKLSSRSTQNNKSPQVTEESNNQFQLTEEAIATLIACNFTASHPSTEVAEHVTEGFFHSTANILTPAVQNNENVLINSKSAYLPLADFHSFLGNLPIIPLQLYNRATSFFTELLERNRINNISAKLIESSLSQTILNSEQLSQLLIWLSKEDEGAAGDLFRRPADKKRLLGNIKFQQLINNDLITIPFSSLKSFQSSDTEIPPNLPLPTTVLSNIIARALSTEQLINTFKLKLFNFDSWLEFILHNEQRFYLESSTFSPIILTYLSKHSGELSASQWRLVKSSLLESTCILTTHGMKRPEQAYIPSPLIGSDLPKIILKIDKNIEEVDLDETEENKDIMVDDNNSTSSSSSSIPAHSQAVSLSFLKSIGCRTMPPISNIVKAESSNHAISVKQLISSLVNQRKDMTESDFQALKISRSFQGISYKLYKENNTNSHYLMANSKLYTPDQLHFPDIAEELSINELIVIAIPKVDLVKHSNEYAFLRQLGVKVAPDLEFLLSYCTSGTTKSNNTVIIDMEDDEVVEEIKNNKEDINPALTFFIKHFKEHYSSDYKSAKYEKLAFLPAFPPKASVNNHNTIMASPSQVFLEDNLFTPVLLPSIASLLLQYNISELIGVKERPTISQAFDLLKSYPITINNASKIFSYLNLLEGLNSTVIQKIAKIRFIPVENSTILKLPNEVFIKPGDLNNQEEKSINNNNNNNSNNNYIAPVANASKKGRKAESKAPSKSKRRKEVSYNKDEFSEDKSFDVVTLPGIIDYVNFGSEANSFLSSIGVLSYPTPSMLAMLLIKNHQNFFNSKNNLTLKEKVNRYISALKYLASNLKLIDKNTANEMNDRAWVIGYLRIETPSTSITNNNSRSNNNSNTSSSIINSDGLNENELEAVPITFKIVSPSECYMIDDHSLERLLNPLSVPEPELYELYAHFGSRWISDAVTKSLSPIGANKTSDRANQLQRLIQQRLPLLLLNRRGERLKGIKPQAENLLKNIKVFEVNAIQCTVQFQGKTKIFKQSSEVSTCALVLDRNSANLYLHTHSEIDYYDIASDLANVLLQHADEGILSHISILLSSSLHTLMRRGLPVERLLKFNLNTNNQLSNDVPMNDNNNNSNLSMQSEEGNISQYNNDNDLQREIKLGGPTRDFSAQSSAENRKIRDLLNRSKAYKGKTFEQTEHLKEEISHSCEAIPAANLVRLSKDFQSIPLFLESGLRLDPTMTSNANYFAQILSGLAKQVFHVKLLSIHMYYDIDGARVAYNTDGSLFFNLRYFSQVHSKNLFSTEEGLKTALTYWFVTFIHELAHNTESGHNALHENYMESLMVHSMNQFNQFAFEFALT